MEIEFGGTMVGSIHDHDQLGKNYGRLPTYIIICMLYALLALAGLGPIPHIFLVPM